MRLRYKPLEKRLPASSLSPRMFHPDNYLGSRWTFDVYYSTELVAWGTRNLPLEWAEGLILLKALRTKRGKVVRCGALPRCHVLLDANGGLVVDTRQVFSYGHAKHFRDVLQNPLFLAACYAGIDAHKRLVEEAKEH